MGYTNCPCNKWSRIKKLAPRQTRLDRRDRAKRQIRQAGPASQRVCASGIPTAHQITSGCSRRLSPFKVNVPPPRRDAPAEPINRFASLSPVPSRNCARPFRIIRSVKASHSRAVRHPSWLPAFRIQVQQTARKTDHGGRVCGLLADGPESTRSSRASEWLLSRFSAPGPTILRTLGEAARTCSIIFVADVPPAINSFPILRSTSFLSISRLIRRCSRFDRRSRSPRVSGFSITRGGFRSLADPRTCVSP
jgi:hypothetical protein